MAVIANQVSRQYVALFLQSGVQTPVLNKGNASRTIDHFRNSYLMMNYGCDVFLCRRLGLGVLESIDARSIPVAANDG